MASLGVYRPALQVSNHDLSEMMDTSDEWIVKRTGIRVRRLAGPQEPLSRMGAAAAERALTAAGAAVADIDCVIGATMSFTGQTPAMAVRIAERLGIAGPPAFDLSAACAGFPYALETARGLIRAGSARTVLVVAAERMTDIVDPRDRATAVLFADGAGAALVTRSDEPGVGPVVWGSDGSLSRALEQRVEWASFRDGLTDERPYLRMEGPRLFRWVIDEMPKVAGRAVAAAGLTLDQIDAFVPHQANIRMIESMVRSLGLPERVVVAEDLRDQGNTSAASIPLALERLAADGDVKPGAVALLLGFGAGGTYAAQVAQLP
ncbi:beta-ketoacyl-ACP synthase 3 [Actinomadura macrotermitis]|uniref:beta-ketoacyl-ACP synthase 3 n=1 Tax=Actinomadura macrotermitis TaxID=2585200 RepID=UPI0038B278C9